MDNKILLRIDSLLIHINEVLSDTECISLEEFKRSNLLLRATCFSMSQIGEQMNKLEEFLSDRYPSVPWKSARTMRNMIVHDYGKTDVEQVYSTIKNDLPLLKITFKNIESDIKKQLLK